MGILPLQFIDGMDRKKLKLAGSELITVLKIEKGINPSDKIGCRNKILYLEIFKKLKLYAELIQKMS